MMALPGKYKLLLILAASIALTAFITWLLALRPTSGSVIREQGPESHKAKAKIPSTGGQAFLATLFLVGFPGALWMQDPNAIIGVATGLLSGLIGFADDILKLSKHDTSGLKARYKLMLQIIVGLLCTGAVYYLIPDDTLTIPFTGAVIRIGFWKIILGIFCYMTIINAVNFTDGLDGLAATTVAIASFCLGGAIWASGGDTTAVVPIILIGICVGFLPWNWNPAKIFMGDSGSLALSGALAAIAIASSLEIVLLIIGLVFLIEIATVVMQVVYFKLTGGKRIFRMTPIHHAWELRGYSERKIVIGASVIGIIAGAVGWWSAIKI